MRMLLRKRSIRPSTIVSIGLALLAAVFFAMSSSSYSDTEFVTNLFYEVLASVCLGIAVLTFVVAFLLRRDGTRSVGN